MNTPASRRSTCSVSFASAPTEQFTASNTPTPPRPATLVPRVLNLVRGVDDEAGGAGLGVPRKVLVDGGPQPCQLLFVKVGMGRKVPRAVLQNQRR